MPESFNQKLSDEFLSNVVGGVNYVDVSAGLACPTLLAGWGCSIASCVYFTKAHKAKKNNDILDYDKYLEKAKKCSIATVSLISGFVGALIVCACGSKEGSTTHNRPIKQYKNG